MMRLKHSPDRSHPGPKASVKANPESAMPGAKPKVADVKRPKVGGVQKHTGFGDYGDSGDV